MAKHEMKTKIAGVTFTDPKSGRDRQEIISRYVRAGNKLKLKLEKNAHAEGGAAVAVWLQRGCVRRRRFHIGYLSEERKWEIIPALQRGMSYTAMVSDVTGGTRQHSTHGVNIVIRWSD